MRWTLTLMSLGLLGLAADARAARDPSIPCWATEACRTSGACSDDGAGGCRLATAADCAMTEGCRSEGRCALVDGACGVPAYFDEGPDPCAKTPACRHLGACAAVEVPRGWICGPTPKSCKATAVCHYLGRCKQARSRDTESGDADPPPCAGTAPALKGSRGCKAEGICAVDVSRAGCKASAACRERGLCAAVEEAFVPDEPAAADVCEATTAGCEASVECATLGRCTPALVGAALVCVAMDETRCRASKACKEYGACTLDNGACRVHAPPARAVCDAKDLVLERPTEVVGSSFHPRFETYTFEAALAADGDPRTSWQPVTTKAGGVGERLTLRFDHDVRVVAVDVGNGFQRQDALGDLFLANSRVRSALITAGATREVAVFDPSQRGLVRTWLPATEAREVSLEVLSVAPGWRWSDLAISEVRVLSCRAR